MPILFYVIERGEAGVEGGEVKKIYILAICKISASIKFCEKV